MCYMTVLSTTSNIDLMEFNSALVTFSKDCHDMAEVNLLKHEHKWLVLRNGETCSCGFRYVERLNIDDLGFSEPEDWSPEDENHISATHEIYHVITRILNEGERIDTFTSWQQDEESTDEVIGDIEINISEVGIDMFRFFDAHHFEYKK
jgi:hypothetical protein